MMIKKSDIQKQLLKSGLLFILFLIFTDLLLLVDVKPIGPDKTKVGFAHINSFFVSKIGVHSILYSATDKLAKISIILIVVFAAVGLYQLIKRKSIRLVDSRILALAVLYAAMLIFYLIFDKIVINYRPVKIFLDEAKPDLGVLQPSYPSSHTLLAICLMLSSAMEVKRLLANYKVVRKIINTYLIFMAVFSVVGRLISGVHWFTDIIGAVLLSAFLLHLYITVTLLIDAFRQKHPPKKQ